VENRFPKIWVPSWQNRDLGQLLIALNVWLDAAATVHPVSFSRFSRELGAWRRHTDNDTER
jgi:hypothetical protein